MDSPDRNIDANSKAARRDEMSRRLRDALEQLLVTSSFTEVSVDRLVKEAGISRSAFYVHFADKADLLRTLCVGLARDVSEAAEARRELSPAATRAELHEAFRVLLDAYRPHARVMRAVAEVAFYDSDVREEFDVLMGLAVAAVAAHIRLGQSSGAVRRSLDADAVATCLTWMIERVLPQVLGTAHPQEAGRHLSAMADVYWNTLYE